MPMGLILSIIAFLFSLPGLVSLLTGFVIFVAMPLVPKVTGQFRSFAHFHLQLGASCVSRMAIVVSEHNDLLYKQMLFDDRGVETIQFGAETKEFEDPAGALHHFKGVPFALADEVHGILFDPRHATVGKRKFDAEEQDELFVEATDSEWELYEVYGWVRGVFEMPKNTFEVVDLSKVRQLMTGIERAEYPDRVEVMYKNSRVPYAGGSGISRFFFPICAFLMTFAGIWLIASQTDDSTGAGSVIEFGVISLLLSLSPITDVVRSFAKQIGRVKWGVLAIHVVVLGTIPLLLLAVAIVINPILAFLMFATMSVGFLTVPLLTLLGQRSYRLGGWLSKTLLKLGMMGFNRPVFVWTQRGYELREEDDLNDVAPEPKWYGLFGSLVGFSFKPSEESWDNEVVDTTDLEARKEAVTDGGNSGSASTKIPSGYSRYPDLTRAVYAAFVPSRIRRSNYYLHSGICMSRFTNAAVGDKSKRRLLAAKQKYGENAWDLSDKAVLYMTAGGGAFGAIMGVVIFFL